MTPDDPPMIDVDVPREVAREAVGVADRQNVAIEDALARLTAWDYPGDVLKESPERSEDCSGQ